MFIRQALFYFIDQSHNLLHFELTKSLPDFVISHLYFHVKQSIWLSLSDPHHPSSVMF